MARTRSATSKDTPLSGRVSKTAKAASVVVAKKKPVTAAKSVKKTPKTKKTVGSPSTGRKVQKAISKTTKQTRKPATTKAKKAVGRVSAGKKSAASAPQKGGNVCPVMGGRQKYVAPSTKPKAGSLEEKLDIIAKEIDRPIDMVTRCIGESGGKIIKKESMAKIQKLAEIAHKLETGEIQEEIMASFGICKGTVPLVYLCFMTSSLNPAPLTLLSTQATEEQFVDPYETFKGSGQFAYFLFADRVRRRMSDDPQVQNSVYRIGGVPVGIAM